MQNKYDLISIGDTTVDVFLELDPTTADAVCFLDKQRCVVSFDYASKIPVSKLTRVPGVGNAANNAVGSSRLGLKTAIYTVTGSDQDSQESKKVLENEDVATGFLVQEAGKRSNFSAVINYSGERTIFVYHEERAYKLPQLPTSSWIYFTSVGKGSEVLNEPLVKHIKTNGVKLGFNPGSHQLALGVEKLKSVLAITQVLLVNREEAYGLVSGLPAGRQGVLQDVKGLLADLKKTGLQIVVITDGRGGSYASMDGREVWFAPIPEDSPVVERTGCGDAYSTGFLAALSRGLEIPEAMVWGTMNATSVIQYIGGREGLLTQRGIEEFKGKYGSFVKPRMI